MRRTARVKLAAPVQILSTDQTPIDGETIDLSEFGIGVFVLTSLPPDQSCMVAIPIPNDKNQRRINFLGTVIYCHSLMNGYRVGLEFKDMDARSRDCIRCLAFELFTCAEKCYQAT